MQHLIHEALLGPPLRIETQTLFDLASHGSQASRPEAGAGGAKGMGSHDHGLRILMLVGDNDGRNQTLRILEVDIDKLTKHEIGLQAEQVLQLTPCCGINRINRFGWGRHIAVLMHNLDVSAQEIHHKFILVVLTPACGPIANGVSISQVRDDAPHGTPASRPGPQGP
jgi:hypothetical protein